MTWYVKVLRHYIDFTGRARRTEFWTFSLINIAITLVLGVIAGVLSLRDSGVLVPIYLLLTLTPWLTVTTRRMHDIGRTGWRQLIVVIPAAAFLAPASLPEQSPVAVPLGIASAIVLGIAELMMLGFLGAAGHQGENRYGPDPKADADPTG